MPRGGSRPGERRGGRKKGTPNKVTGALKDLILSALDEAGGQAYLVTQASANPTAFLTLVGKVLPLQVTGKDGESIQIPPSIAFIVNQQPGATNRT